MVYKAQLAISHPVPRVYRVPATPGLPIPGTYPAHFSVRALALAVPSPGAALPTSPAPDHLLPSPPHKGISGLKSFVLRFYFILYYF